MLVHRRRKRVGASNVETIRAAAPNTAWASRSPLHTRLPNPGHLCSGLRSPKPVTTSKRFGPNDRVRPEQRHAERVEGRPFAHDWRAQVSSVHSAWLARSNFKLASLFAVFLAPSRATHHPLESSLR